MNCVRVIWFVAVVLVLSQPMRAAASETFRFPEAQCGKGELRYIQGIPVLTVEGSPAEIGEQLGELALKPAVPLRNSADQIVADFGWTAIYNLVLKSGNFMLPSFPADHAAEVDAAASASDWPREFLVFANTILDLRRVVGCSSFTVEAARSTTGGPLLGRNLDWPPIARLHEYTLVIVCRPAGKHAFASVTFPGVLGCTSGMNDAGLTIAMLDSYQSRDGSPGLNPRGIPTVLLLRRLLEECTTLDEAVTLLQSVERASMLNIAICDKQRAAVLEVTPKNVVVRPAEDGISMCTNHFRSPELGGPRKCWRYDTLAKRVDRQQFSVSDIAQRLHSVNQGELTLQSMVFEPTTLQLHLVFGEGPATRRPMSRLDLAELFKPESAP